MILRALLLVGLGWAVFLGALGAQTPLSPNFEVRNAALENEVYDPEYGTRGMLFRYEYRYTTKRSRPRVGLPTARVFLAERCIYTDSGAVQLVESNRWAQARHFIPYRAIDLKEGRYPDVRFVYELPGLLRFEQVVPRYEQPLRYGFTVQLQKGSVKEQLQPWDVGALAQRPPDVYWQLTTNEGRRPIIASLPVDNLFQLRPQRIEGFLLENELPKWSFYDFDGGQDTLLGTYELPKPNSDFRESYHGQMFGDIKGLDFQLFYRQMRTQPITIRAQANYQHQGRVGLRLDLVYHLAQVYEGSNAIVRLEQQSEKNNRLPIETAIPLGRTQTADGKVKLRTHDTLSYFIPFYAWNNDNRWVYCSMQMPDGVILEAAPLFLYEPIRFQEFAYLARCQYFPNQTYKGVQGLRIEAVYHVRDIHAYSTMRLQLLDANGAPLPARVFRLHAKGQDELPDARYETKRPPVRDSLVLFVPYVDLQTTPQLEARLSFIPDVELVAFRKQIPNPNPPRQTRFVQLEKHREADLCLENDYGKVLGVDYRVPFLFAQNARLVVRATRNGEVFASAKFVGCAGAATGCVLPLDSGLVQVLFPYRALKPLDKIELEIVATDSLQRLLSDPLVLRSAAPEQINMQTLAVSLTQFKYDRQALPTKGDTSQRLDWELLVKVGSDTHTRDFFRLPPKSIRLKDIAVHLEDKIAIYTVLADSVRPREVLLWRGDVGKIEKSGGTHWFEQKYPFDRLKLHLTLGRKRWWAF